MNNRATLTDLDNLRWGAKAQTLVMALNLAFLAVNVALGAPITWWWMALVLLSMAIFGWVNLGIVKDIQRRIVHDILADAQR